MKYVRQAPRKHKVEIVIKTPREPQVYVYCRCSSEVQDTSIEFQKKEIIQYCTKNELPFKDDPEHIFEDEAISGYKTEISDRKFSLIKDKVVEGDHIIIYDISRLARKMYDVAEIAKFCENKKISLHLIKTQMVIIPDDLKSKLFVMCLAMAAEIERILLVERTKSGLEAARKREYTAPRDKRIAPKKKAIAPPPKGRESEQGPFYAIGGRGKLGNTYTSTQMYGFHDKIVELLRKDYLQYEIAKELDIPQSTLSDHIRKHKLKDRAKELGPLEKDVPNIPVPPPLQDTS